MNNVLINEKSKQDNIFMQKPVDKCIHIKPGFE